MLSRIIINKIGNILKPGQLTKVLAGTNSLCTMAESSESAKRVAKDEGEAEAKRLKTDEGSGEKDGQMAVGEDGSKDGKTVVEVGVSKDGQTVVGESTENKEEKEYKPVLRKKKVALMMMYSGVGYQGMQRNPGFPTIEEDLIKALHTVGAIPDDHADHMQKMQFQRAARTDKGVSAAGQLVSLKLLHNIPQLVDKINDKLPKQIKVISIKRTTATFNSKNYCDARTYSYMLPTYSFTPIEEVVYQSHRVPEGVIDHVNKILGIYKGTHNFHNFTSGKKADDPSANRYIIDMACSEPFVQDNIEYAVITVKGQSFMLHQIRKMIGLMVAIVRGMASLDCIQKAFSPYKVDVPKAPGLGLMLERLHYETYNRRFGKDGVHEPLDWDVYKEDIDEFKKNYIYSTMIETEKKEKTMMGWLSTLFSHNFDYRMNVKVPPRAEVGTGRAEFLVEKVAENKDNGNDNNDNDKVSKSDNSVSVEMDTNEKTVESDKKEDTAKPDINEDTSSVKLNESEVLDSVKSDQSETNVSVQSDEKQKPEDKNGLDRQVDKVQVEMSDKS